jgi:hypothetical protein
MEPAIVFAQKARLKTLTVFAKPMVTVMTMKVAVLAVK